MKVLIDSSAWIEFFRGRGDPAVKDRVRDLVSTRLAAYTCPVRYELFTGARPHERSDLEEGFGYAQRFNVTPHHWDRAAAVAAILRAEGLNFPSFDILIAAVAETENMRLYTLDGHFTAIRDRALPALTLY